MFSATVLGVALHDALWFFLTVWIIGVVVELRRQHRRLAAVHEGEVA